MPEQDPLAHLLYRLNTEGAQPLLRSNARVPVPGRPGEWMEPITRPTESRRNQAKVMALRKFLGIPGDDYGDVSQVDYEEAAADAERRQQAALTTQYVQPQAVSGRYNVEAAEAQGRAYNQREAFQEAQQARQQTFQAGENKLNRAAMSERQQNALGAPMVPTLNPETGIAEWVPRVQAAGLRTGGSSTEREAIQKSAESLASLDSLMQLGNETQWKGIGLAGTPKNLMYKYLGIGDPREDTFRLELQKFGNDIMFGTGGKQLTPTEMKLARSYLADINTNPQATQTRLVGLRTVLQRAQDRRLGRVSLEDAERATMAEMATGGGNNEWEDVR